MAPLLFLFLLLLLPSPSSADDGQQISLWCVAKNNAEDGPLQAALDWACGPAGGAVDCTAVQEGGACFEPDVLQFHASYAFNEYYSRRPSDPTACDFAGNAVLTQLDPVGSMSGVSPNCKFPASLSASQISRKPEQSPGPGGPAPNGVGRNQLDRNWASWAFCWAYALLPLYWLVLSNS